MPKPVLAELLRFIAANEDLPRALHGRARDETAHMRPYGDTAGLCGIRR